MAQLQRIEGQVELQCNADKYFDILTKAYLVPKIISNKAGTVELLEGEWDKAGAICNWTYSINENGDSKLISSKIRVEEMDFENRLYAYDYIEGHVRESYKTLQGKMEILPKGEGCIMKLTLEYEKMNEDVPEPNSHVDLELDVAKDIDAYLCNL